MLPTPQGQRTGIAVVAAVCLLGTGAATPELRWQPLPPLPDPVGLAGTFAGVTGGALLVAGGANFPDRMPWAGGQKRWHDRVYILETPDGTWREAGRLPRPLAYGVSVSDADSVICVGGGDTSRHEDMVFRLRWREGRLQIAPLPSLPTPLAFSAGAIVKRVLYVAGGTDAPGETRALNRLFALALDSLESGWRELAPIPGAGRLLPVAAARDHAFLLLGGAALERDAAGRLTRVYLREAWGYRPDAGWTRLADLPAPVAGAPSPAPVVGDRVLVLAGDDGSRAGFEPRDRHPGFVPRLLTYDAAHDRWSTSDDVPAPRATAPCVSWQGAFVIPSGEVRPGVRSPEVWSLRPR